MDATRVVLMTTAGACMLHLAVLAWQDRRTAIGRQRLPGQLALICTLLLFVVDTGARIGDPPEPRLLIGRAVITGLIAWYVIARRVLL